MIPKKKTPPGLSKKAQHLWQSTIHDFVIESSASFLLLEAACRSWDRLREAQRLIAKEGAVVKDRFGQPRQHPALEIEKQASSEFRALLKQLGMEEDENPVRGPGRPPGAGMRGY